MVRRFPVLLLSTIVFPLLATAQTCRTETIKISGVLPSGLSAGAPLAEVGSYLELNSDAVLVTPIELSRCGVPLLVAFSPARRGNYSAAAYIDGAAVGGTSGKPTLLGASMRLRFTSSGRLATRSSRATLTAAIGADYVCAPRRIRLNLRAFRRGEMLSVSSPAPVTSFTCR